MKEEEQRLAKKDKELKTKEKIQKEILQLEEKKRMDRFNKEEAKRQQALEKKTQQIK